MTRRSETIRAGIESAPSWGDSDTLSGATLARAAYYFGPLLLWMSVIFCLSTDWGSTDNTLPAVKSILLKLWPHAPQYLSGEMIDRIDWNIRKTAHVTEYAVLGLLAFRAVAMGRRGGLAAHNVLLPLAIGLLCAAADEVHQSFVPSRTGAAADVFFDAFGVMAGLVLSLGKNAVSGGPGTGDRHRTL